MNLYQIDYTQLFAIFNCLKIYLIATKLKIQNKNKLQLNKISKLLVIVNCKFLRLNKDFSFFRYITYTVHSKMNVKYFFFFYDLYEE